MLPRSRWSGRQQSDEFQSVWRCDSEAYCWFGKTGGLKGDHSLRGRSGQLVLRAMGLEDVKIVSIYLEKSIVR